VKSTLLSGAWLIAALLGCLPSRAAPPLTVPGIDLKMTWIAPGSFVMGSPPTEPGRGANEDPSTRVTITQGYWLGTYEVTHGQWKAMMGTDLAAQAHLAQIDDRKYLISLKNWMYLRDFAGVKRDGDPLQLVGNTDDNVPITWVSWEEAMAFCRKLTARERAAGRLPVGYEFRLPTEAQWEYACRAGTTTATYAGEMVILDDTTAPVLDAIAWTARNSAVGYTGHAIDTGRFSEKKSHNAGRAGPRTVGTKRPNAWGLYDMLGNAGEWCLDWNGKYPGGSVADWTGPAAGFSHVRRGGGWSSSAHGVRAAYRNWHEPTYRWINLGFRIALVRPPFPRASAVQGEAGDSSDRMVPEIGLSLARIEPGTFLLGSPETEAHRGKNEGPQMEVTLTRAYWLGTHEVTQAQWRALMGTNGVQQARRVQRDDTRFLIGGKRMIPLREFFGLDKDGDTMRLVGNTDDNLPMIWVTWDECMAFCRKLTAAEKAAGRLPAGYEYRLPTEAEWEYAARAGSTAPVPPPKPGYPAEAGASPLDAVAWYAANSGTGYSGHPIDTHEWPEQKEEAAGRAGPRAVGTKAPNAWGLYDTLGNAAEWCMDFGGRYPGGKAVDWAGPPSGRFHVRRGGGWSSFGAHTRVAFRNWHESNFSFINLGFRVALAPVMAAPGVSLAPDFKFTWVEPGKFLMGTPGNEPKHRPNESPRTEVTLTKGFWLGTFEVTNGQWKKWMGTDVAHQAALALHDNRLYLIGAKERIKLRDFFGWKPGSDPAQLIGNRDDDLPIIWVSWEEASAFCQKLTAAEREAGRLPAGYVYRLPTEAEWEFAARAGTTTATYAGEMRVESDATAPVLDDIAWYAGNASAGYEGHRAGTDLWPEKKWTYGRSGPRSIGTKVPNAWGLYDMLGNAAEWCLDWDGAYPGGAISDPTGPATGTYHVRRGGSWSSLATQSRAGYRNWHEPTYRWINLGFRVALAPDVH
jgi:sulfatase modifying factor 1